MYIITLVSGEEIWMNERIIKQITLNQDKTFTLHHFNDSKIIIKNFRLFK